MLTINLLPDDFLLKGVVKVARIIKKILVPVFAIFFISSTVMLGIILVLNGNLKGITNNQEILTTSIKNLEKTERGMLLLQERLAKIKNIMSKDSSKGKITQNIQAILELSSEVTVSNVKIISNKINLDAKAATSDQLGQFFSQILESTLYKEVILTDFSFNPATGYSLGLDLTTK